MLFNVGHVGLCQLLAIVRDSKLTKLLGAYSN